MEEAAKDKGGEKAAELTALSEVLNWIGDKSVAQTCEVVKFFRLTKCFQKKEDASAGKAEQVRVTMAFSSSQESQRLRALMLKVLEDKGYVVKTGRAPAGYLARDLQQWLELLTEWRR